jgi:hypothetical protein
MSEQLNLKTKIQDLFDTTPDSINSVSYGRKYKSGLETNDLCIVFGVDKKKRIEDLSQEEILPSEIIIDGKKYLTDVVEKIMPTLLTCNSYSPGTESNSNIQKLRGNPTLLIPLKGGQEIIKFPTNWVSAGGGSYNISVGTLGFFAVDNNDNKLVGVTNTHVAVSRQLYCNDKKNSEGSKINPYNSCLPDFAWPDGNKYHPGQLSSSSNSIPGYWNLTCQYIKRYRPFSTSKTNYIDAALLVMNPSYVDSNSYMIHQPDGDADYTAYMPFATTAEIDNLLTTDPTVYSTGRTTGPKGYGNTSSCQLRITAINDTSDIGFDDGIAVFSDLIIYKYRDNSLYPNDGGDSGSALVAVISGVRKIIGLVFAGNGTEGLAIRIDRIANDLNIRAWDSNYTLNTTLPTPEYRVAKVSFGYGGSDSVVIGGKQFYQAGFIKRNNPTFIKTIPFGLAPITSTPSATVLTVTNSSASAYVINGSSNPTLNLIRGLTYTFNISAAGHPFWIKTIGGTGTGNAYSTGITSNGTASGTLTFVVDASAPSTLYYNCEIHGLMAGVINISG